MVDAKMIFHTSHDNLVKVQRTMRNLPSLRFSFSPYLSDRRNQKYHVGISGNVGDMNSLSAYLAEIEKPKIEKKRSFLEKIADVFKSD